MALPSLPPLQVPVELCSSLPLLPLALLVVALLVLQWLPPLQVWAEQLLRMALLPMEWLLMVLPQLPPSLLLVVPVPQQLEAIELSPAPTR